MSQVVSQLTKTFFRFPSINSCDDETGDKGDEGLHLMQCVSGLFVWYLVAASLMSLSVKKFIDCICHLVSANWFKNGLPSTLKIAGSFQKSQR